MTRHESTWLVELNQTIELLNATRAVMADAIVNLMDARNGYPAAHAYDTADSRGPVPWCWRHGQDIRACAANGSVCRGEIIEIHDPTGEAGIIPDHAQTKIRRLNHALNQLRRHAGIVADIVAEYGPRHPDDSARRRTADVNTLACAHCRAMLHIHEDSIVKTPTDVSGVLVIPMLLCRWDRDFVRTNGRLPTRAECERNKAGQRVRLPA